MSPELDRHIAALAANPRDVAAFEALEEGYFLAGAWQQLVLLYDDRVERAGIPVPKQRAALLHRAGQILEERCLEPEQAIERYTRAIQLDPTFRPALQQLRRIHTGRGAWDLVLQVAEVEIGAPMAPYERAEFFAEMGEVWLVRLGEPTEAMSCFEQSLGIDPEQKRALAGLAATLEAIGQMRPAAETWERLSLLVRGPDRAAPLVALARLCAGPLDEPGRAVECYRRALADDPRNDAAVEALIVVATERGAWQELADLFEKRFALASGARRRTAIALEAGRLHLERLDDADRARAWFARAFDLSADDTAVHLAFADLERSLRNDDALLPALERVVKLGEASRSVLVELASLHAERGDDERALLHLERAQTAHPHDPLILAALSDTLSNLGRYEELANVLEKRVAIEPTDPDARATLLCELGDLFHGALQDSDAAREAFERAFDASPRSACTGETLERIYRKAEAWEPLRAMLERAGREGAPDERAAFLCSLGELLKEQFADSEASARAFEQALDLSPGAARGLAGLAALARSAGDEDALLAVYELEVASVSEGPRIVELSRELARLYEARDKHDDALAAADRVLGVLPEDREALETVARLQDVPGREEVLLVTLRRLEDLVRGKDQAAIRRRMAELHLARSEEAAAIDYWEAALESDPDDAKSLAALRARYASLDRAEDLAPVLRKLADLLPSAEKIACLEELAVLLEDRLGDLDAAIVVLWRLTANADCPGAVLSRLEALLERSGRFEELAQRLLERRRSLEDESDEAIALDLRRGWLLVDPLCQFEQAVRVFESVRQRAAGASEATRGLDRALRASNDSRGLAQLLAELAERESDPTRARSLRFERAVLLEDELDLGAEARSEYASLADDEPLDDTTAGAARRLENLLERTHEWSALRERLEAGVAHALGEVAREQHQRIARLCRDRLHDPEGAAAHFEAAARLSPSSPDVWRSLGALYEELERPDDLLRVIEAELGAGCDPDREPALHARGAFLSTQREAGDEQAAVHYERLIELSPGHAEATEFLAARYARAGRSADVERLLVARLDALGREDARTLAGADDAEKGLRTSLALRIATLRSEDLDDLDGAICLLEAAAERDGPISAAATPLADLYRLAGRDFELVALCERAAAACADPRERALWLLRTGDELKECGKPERAAEAYERALRECPERREAEDALFDLYRRTGEAEPLAHLLERRLARADRGEEVSIRMELARLFENDLDREGEALVQLARVIALEPDQAVAFEHALSLAGKLSRHDDQLEMIDARLERRMLARERAALLERRADLLADPIGASDHSVVTYREALALEPNLRSARESLRRVLERLGRFSAVLDCLHVEAIDATRDERVSIFLHAVDIATENIGPDASLPWLERLRAERPDDGELVARVADVHRLAGRFESVLRAIEDELAIGVEPDRERDLQLARARIFERDMHAPGRATFALEAALAIAPEDGPILEKLDALYAGAGRARERVTIVERRLACGAGDPLALHRTAAMLYRDVLADSERAIPHLESAVALIDAALQPEAASAQLEELAKSLRASNDACAFARVAEAQLALALASAREAAVGARQTAAAARGHQLRRDLALAYLTELHDGRAALDHLRALTRACPVGAEAPPGLSPAEFDSLEQAMLERLRADNNPVELEQRLAARLERSPGTRDEWLELARTREERLGALERAREAYREALARDANSLAAIRGISRLSELLSDWDAVAFALELELALPRPATGEASLNENRNARDERAPLYRKLGAICWHRLAATDRAVDAYESALEADGQDVASLRCLEELHARREEWPRALDCYEREVEILGPRDPERRHAAWMTVADLARQRTAEPERALRACERASAIAPLAAHAQLVQALLYRECERHDRFLEVYTAWCDGPTEPADCGEQLVLVEALREYGRSGDALERAVRISRSFAEDARAWEALASLSEEAGEPLQAGDAFAAAGALRSGSEAASHFLAAARLVEQSDKRRAFDRLQQAVASDAGEPATHANLARVAFDLGRFEDATRAAGRGLDLFAADLADAEASRGRGEIRALQLATALVGGRAADELDRPEAATLFFGSAIAIEPGQREALEAQGRLLFERGDLCGARGITERRIALEADDDEPDARAGRLTRLATIHELEGDADAAIAHFERALAIVPGDVTAHAGCARIHQKASRIDASIAALETWAEVDRRASNPEGCARRLLDAAELELEGGRNQAAEAHLVRSTGVFPGNARSWILTAELLFDAGRFDALLRLVPEALTFDGVADVDDAVSRLSLLYGRVLDRRGERELASEAYGLALARNNRCAEGALERARLLRAAGAWAEAADVLARFCEGHPEPAHRDLAEAYCKLADLRAGPLEDVDGAINCYERALEIWPQHPRAREPLATLLFHRPERFADALSQHALVLADSPTRTGSIRALARMAERRGDDAGHRMGLALLRALGAASPAEERQAPDILDPSALRAGGTSRDVASALEEPLFEAVRRMTQLASEALGQTLTRTRGGLIEGAAPRDSFSTSLAAARTELSAPGLALLGNDALSSVLYRIAAIACGEESEAASVPEDEGLQTALGRWTRRKIRRALDGATPEDIRELDAAAFRDALEGLAAEQALAHCGGDLRAALVSRCGAEIEIGASEDLSARLADDPTACALLRRLERAWCRHLSLA